MSKKRLRSIIGLFLGIALLVTCFKTTVFATEGIVEKRVLFEDDFDANDGAKWNVSCGNNATIDFSNGQVNVKGGGRENRLSTISQVVASDFTIDLDVWFNEENTNCAFKVGFKSDSQCLNSSNL